MRFPPEIASDNTRNLLKRNLSCSQWLGANLGHLCTCSIPFLGRGGNNNGVTAPHYAFPIFQRGCFRRKTDARKQYFWIYAGERQMRPRKSFFASFELSKHIALSLKEWRERWHPEKKLFHVPSVKNVPRVLLHKEIHLHFQEWINFIFLLTPLPPFHKVR